ncbi:MAG: SAM-dependent methyltransferase [Candidatus Azotimanducaceae bacterium]|jgi:SAM-dependent methyltransferase
MQSVKSSMSLIGPESQDQTNEFKVLTRMLDFGGAKVDEIQHRKNLQIADLDKVTFKSFGAENIDAENQSFDIALMFKSLHHVPLDQLDVVFQEIYRVLRPGGVAYFSEPVFSGVFNNIMQVYHDEELVRKAAFEAIQRGVRSGLFQLEEEYFFENHIQMDSWAQYEKRMLDVTHTEHRLSADQYAEVKRRFLASETSEGYVYNIPNRVDLLKKRNAA